MFAEMAEIELEEEPEIVQVVALPTGAVAGQEIEIPSEMAKVGKEKTKEARVLARDSLNRCLKLILKPTDFSF